MGIYSVTGHRPNKLFTSDPYSNTNIGTLIRFCAELLIELKPELIYQGGALGFDQAIAVACITLEIPYITCIPFEGQESRWLPSSKRMYENILNHSQNNIVVSPPGFAAWKMQKRNEYMVDQADKVIALWDGNKQGGTWNCINYTQKQDKKIINYWDKWNSLI